MAIIPPRLDDRSFDDLVTELISRIPAHTKEWTNPRPGDPGRTILELFAWLADTILYRANLIPERQRLVFLKLLGIPMLPAEPARGMVSVHHMKPASQPALSLAPRCTVKGSVSFETLDELTVLPVEATPYIKRPLTTAETKEMASVIQAVQSIYGEEGSEPIPYVTTPAFPNGVNRSGLDVITDTVDQSLWLALTAAEPDTDVMEDAYAQLISSGVNNGPAILNVGIVPTLLPVEKFDTLPELCRIRTVWEISTPEEIDGEPVFMELDVLSDGTDGLTRDGVIRLRLPAGGIGAPSNDVRDKIRAGVGLSPPRLDDTSAAERLITWIRLRPVERLENLKVSFASINAVTVEQRQTVKNRIVGVGDGTIDQQITLGVTSVDPTTFTLQVEEPESGFKRWRQVSDLAAEGRDATVYQLDPEAGTVRFGDGVRGRVPGTQMRIRVELMRFGGGKQGNLPAGSITKLNGVTIDGKQVTTPLKIVQDIETRFGDDAETIEAAEQRIPSYLRHRNRAVTETDFRQLALETPGTHIGRVEVLQRFKPHQRREDVPGVVSVMVLPYKQAVQAPNPRPDRPLIEVVHARLDQRRTVGCELYVIGTEYVPIGVSVAVELREGAAVDTTLLSVKETLRNHLWPLAPGGADQKGWPLGYRVKSNELEAVVARVDGITAVNDINLFDRENDRWRVLRRENTDTQQVLLEKWQLPELLGVVVVEGDEAPLTLKGVPDPFEGKDSSGKPGRAPGIAVPVVPEVC